MTTCLLSIEQLDTAGHVNLFIQTLSIFICLCIVGHHIGVRMLANIRKVEDLALSQKDKS